MAKRKLSEESAARSPEIETESQTPTEEKKKPPRPNLHDTRESWLRSATALLRPYFAECGYPIPENIRFAIAFPSTGRQGKRVGELWHASTSDDGTYELIIRADLANPLDVLGVLVHELLHVVLPIDAGHGKLYRDAALKIGLEGQMRHAMPSHLLRPRLVAIADDLGPLPHARLNMERGRENKGPIDRPKKQGTRLLKAECAAPGCGYTVRVTGKWVDDLGPPHCPKHGAMTVERGEDEAATAAEEEASAKNGPASPVPPGPAAPLRQSV